MRQDDLKALARDLGTATRAGVAEMLAPVLDRITALELGRSADQKRIKALETRPTLEYKGVWNADESYSENSAATHNGSVWIAKAANHGVEPGTDARWQLAVKKGRDAR